MTHIRGKDRGESSFRNIRIHTSNDVRSFHLPLILFFSAWLHSLLLKQVSIANPRAGLCLACLNHRPTRGSLGWKVVIANRKLESDLGPRRITKV